MSETNKKIKNTAVACAEMKETDKGLVVDQGKYSPSRTDINTLAGIEIKVEGYEIVLDEKTGKILRVQDNRTISEIVDDERRRKIKEAMKTKEQEGIEH